MSAILKCHKQIILNLFLSALLFSIQSCHLKLDIAKLEQLSVQEEPQPDLPDDDDPVVNEITFQKIMSSEDVEYYLNSSNFCRTLGLSSGEVLVIASTHFEIFNPTTKKSTYYNPVSYEPTCGELLELPNGNVLMVGGYEGSDTTTKAQILNMTNKTWTTISSLSQSRSIFEIILVDNQNVLVSGGYYSESMTIGSRNTFEKLDLNTMTWSTIGTATLAGWYHTSIRLNSTELLFVGYGFVGESSILNTSTMTLSAGPTMSSTDTLNNYFGLVSVEFDDDGINGKRVVLAPHRSINNKVKYQIYSYNTNSFIETAAMSVERSNTLLIKKNNSTLLVCGGLLTTDSSYTDLCEELNINTRTWSMSSIKLPVKATNFLRRIENSNYQILSNPYKSINQIGLFDGLNIISSSQYYPDMGITEDSSSIVGYKNSEIYFNSEGKIKKINTVTKTFTETNNNVPSRMSLSNSSIYNHIVPLTNGKHFIFGFGSNEIIYDITTGVSIDLGSQLDNLFGASAVQIDENKILIISGINFDTFQLDAVGIIYDLQLKTITSITNPPSARAIGQAIKISDQEIMVLGGISDLSATPNFTYDIYNYINNSWSYTAASPVGIQKEGFTLVSLKNNKILLMGGNDVSNNTSDESYIFDLLSKSWSSSNVMNSQRAYGSIAKKNDSVYYLIGGTSNDSEGYPTLNLNIEKLLLPQ